MSVSQVFKNMGRMFSSGTAAGVAWGVGAAMGSLVAEESDVGALIGAVLTTPVAYHEMISGVKEPTEGFSFLEMNINTVSSVVGMYLAFPLTKQFILLGALGGGTPQELPPPPPMEAVTYTAPAPVDYPPTRPLTRHSSVEETIKAARLARPGMGK